MPGLRRETRTTRRSKTSPTAFFAIAGTSRSRRSTLSRERYWLSAAPCASVSLRSWHAKYSTRSKLIWKNDADPLPLRFRLAGTMIHRSGQHEQQIRQTIDVRQQVRLDVIGAERDNRSLRAPANRSREVQQCASTIASRQNESPKRRQLGFEPIDPVFETLHVAVGDSGFCDALGDFLGRICQPRADGEQILLQLFEQLGDITGELALRAHRAEACVQLVDVSVCRHSRIGFRDAGSAEQRGAAGVASACVDLHGRQYT